MDEEEFETIRRWAEGLVSDPSVEVRAAGRAILLLAAEVDRLQVELWHARLGVESEGAVDSGAAGGARPGAAEFERDLRAQARSALGRAARLARHLHAPHIKRAG